MKKRILSFNDLVQKYFSYIRRRQSLILANKNQRRQAILAKHIVRLHAKLTSLKLTMQKGSLAAGVVAGAITISPNNSNAQNFAAPVTNPFSLSNGFGGLGSPTFYDLDNDGDLDMLAEDGSSGNLYFENTGTNIAPDYAAAQLNPFGIDATLGSWRDVKFVDLDNDGDADLIMGSNGDWEYQENTGTSSAPVFAAVSTNPFNLTYSYDYSVCDFQDLDNDGDIDMMAGNYYGQFYYYENTGSTGSPNFESPVINPFGLATLSLLDDDYNAPALADLDNDGDFDILAGDKNGNFYYFENTGTASAPAFAAQVLNPFNLVNVGGPNGYYATPTFVDLDDDGDMDIMTKSFDTADGDFIYFENTSINAGISETSNFANLKMYPNPSNGLVNFDFSDLNEDLQINILSVDGKVVYTQESFNGNHLTLDASLWSSGMYTVKITDSSNAYSMPLVVE
jgi:hypothetical protein